MGGQWDDPLDLAEHTAAARYKTISGMPVTKVHFCCQVLLWQH